MEVWLPLFPTGCSRSRRKKEKLDLARGPELGEGRLVAGAVLPIAFFCRRQVIVPLQREKARGNTVPEEERVGWRR